MGAWHVGIDLVFLYTMTAISIMLITIPPATADSLLFDFPAFQEGDLSLEGDASVSYSWVFVTGNRENSVGRAIHLQEMHLWDANSRKLSDFWTTFSYRMDSNPHEKYSGDWFAFFLADPNLSFSNNTEEKSGLGLIDSEQVLITQPSFVALEFDILRFPLYQSEKVVSSFTRRLDSGAYITPVYFDCSINYNSKTHNLSITCDIQHLHINMHNRSYEVDLSEYLPERVILGFSASTGNSTTQHILRSWSLDSRLDLPTSESKKESKGIRYIVHSKWMQIVISTAMAMGSLGLVCFLMWKWKKTKGYEEYSIGDLKKMDEEIQKGSGPKKYGHDELVAATNNFSDAKKLGHGGFGGVYQGFLKDLNSFVAIKRVSKDSKQGIKEYATEVTIISQLRHRNLVQLIGWCHKKKDLLLIYEFMPNGSLDLHLYRGRSLLTWEVRYKIALNVASALLYLHEEREQCVLHRDIKSSNIMLDSSFNAKLGDFGLARLMDHKKRSQTTVIRGTRGYIAPEYFITGKASKESDIYSFGVVLLEIASGRKPIDLNSSDEITIVEWVWELYGLGKILEVADSGLCGDFEEKQMEHLVIVGIWCAHPDQSSRPSIRQVIQVLNFEAPLPILPQHMPVPTYHPPAVDGNIC